VSFGHRRRLLNAINALGGKPPTRDVAQARVGNVKNNDPSKKGSVFPGVQTGHGNRTRYFVTLDQKHAAVRC
jgi:hypothetical protein